MFLAGFSVSGWLVDLVGHVAQGIALGFTARQTRCPDVVVQCPAPVVQCNIEIYVFISFGGLFVLGVVVGYFLASCRRSSLENDSRAQVLIARQRNAGGR